VVSRARLPRQQLLRLCLGVDGLVHLDPSQAGSGRGAWVAPSAEALQRLTERPGMLGRSLRQKQPRTADLLAEAREDLERRVLSLLRAAHRSGRTRFLPDAEGAVLRVLALEAEDLASAAAPPALRLALDARALGASLRREEVSRIALLPCRPTRMLLATLQEATSLGYPAR